MGGKVSNPNTTNIVTGTYTGNGGDNRSIDIGIDLTAKLNPFVLVKGNNADDAIFRVEYAQGDLSFQISNTDAANMIQQFDATGFEVGSDNSVNANGVVFRYVAIWQR